LVYYFCTTFFEKTNIMSKFGLQSWRLAGSLLVAFALTGCGGGGGGTTPPTIAYDVPELMYYTFDGSGTSVPNLASAPVGGPWGTSAEIQGTMTQGGLGQFNGGLIGTGEPSYLDRLNTGWATKLSGDWTISLYLDNIPLPATLAYLFGDYDAGFLALMNGNGIGGANYITLKAPGMVDVVATNPVLTPSSWVTHFVYDSSGGAIIAYVNGDWVATVGQAPLTINAFPGGGPFLVGGYSPFTGLTAGGILDEFRMYNRALSAAEIAATWDQSLPVYN
jgi:hypothetical protein